MADDNRPLGRIDGPSIRIPLARPVAAAIIKQGGNLDDAADALGRTPREVHDLFEEPKDPQ